MEETLDNVEHVLSVDKGGMLAEIARFAENAEKAIIDSLQVDLGDDFDCSSVLIAGMGGSAVGGLVLSDWLLYTTKVPIQVSRGYHLPGWVDEKTLVYAVSYSGNTEETLSQYHEARERGCRIICFCSGGELEGLAKENGDPVVYFKKGVQPRAAIPFQFFSLAAVSKKVGLIEDVQYEEILETLEVTRILCDSMRLDVPTEENMGKQLANILKEYVPFVYAPRQFQAVAYRYSTQFNENSKSPAATNFFPEAFHNSIMAMEGSEDLLCTNCVVVIRDPLEGERLAKKIGISKDLMSEKFGRLVEVQAVGKALLTRMMSALLIGDFASAYLGVLYGIDPGTTDSIESLKASMKD
jgi:glucose/mannose-6-phosphate isomerase